MGVVATGISFPLACAKPKEPDFECRAGIISVVDASQVLEQPERVPSDAIQLYGPSFNEVVISPNTSEPRFVSALVSYLRHVVVNERCGLEISLMFQVVCRCAMKYEILSCSRKVCSTQIILMALSDKIRATLTSTFPKQVNYGAFSTRTIELDALRG